MLSHMGGSALQLYWTAGPYDLAGSVEAPDDETVSARDLAFASCGAIRTTALRAFDREEIESLLARIP